MKAFNELEPSGCGKKIFLLVTLFCFVLWCSGFIYVTSSIAIDGKRYFCLFDDAMISMRYAWNFAHGKGLIWNAGERVEGYSNLLMTLLMTLPCLFLDKSNSVLAVQVFGVIVMIMSAFISLKVAERLVVNLNPHTRDLIGLLTFFSVLSYYPLVYWTLMGMETGLLTFLVLAATLNALAYMQSPSWTPLVLTSFALGLAMLTRNDAIIFACIIGVVILGVHVKDKNLKLISFRVSIFVGLCTLFVFSQLLFRWIYYGEIVPNTYTLKLAGIPLLPRLHDGFAFVLLFFNETLLVIVIAITGLLFSFTKEKLWLLSFLLLAVCYQIWVGGESWPYWRMMAPSMPFVLMVSVITIVLFFETMKNRLWFHLRSFPQTRIDRMFRITVFCSVLLMMYFTNRNFIWQIIGHSPPFTTPKNASNVNVAIALNEVTHEEATVGVFWAGTIPYYVNRHAIDFLGKSDKHIANLPPDLSGNVSWNGMKSVPGHNKYDLEYSISYLHPTFVQDIRWYSQDLSALLGTVYEKVHYKNVPLFLQIGSPHVRWETISNSSQR